MEDIGIHWSRYSAFEYNDEPYVVFASFNGYTDTRMLGIEFVRKLKNMDKNIKIIFMTAFQTEIDELRELSDVEPLKKPIGLETLVSLIKILKVIEK